MAEDKTKSLSIFAGANRRAFERHPIDLDAKITIAGSADIHRKIRDFCVGGMLLVDTQHSQKAGLSSTYHLNEGDLIDVHFSTDAANDIEHCLHARIVRQDVDSSGIALLEPDLMVLQSLLEVAKVYQQQQFEAEAFDSSQQINADLIAECTDLVVSNLVPLSIKTHDKIISSLFEQSKILKDIAEQNIYFETLGILNDNRDKFTKAFSQHAIERMASIQNGRLLDFSANTDAFSDNTTELAIVEEEVLDNWLADTGTIESVQRTHNEALMQLVRRLSQLFATTVTHDTNPYGPALFTQAFHESILSFGLNHKVTLVCHKVFKSVLTSMLGELYKKLNGHLISRGVLPELTYDIPHEETSVEEDFHALQEQSVDQKESDVEDLNDQSASNQSAGNQSAGNQSADKPEITPAAGDMSNHNIYELVSELRTLKRQLREQSSTTNSVSGEVVEGAAAQDAISTGHGVALTQNEVLQTLTRIESSCTELNRDDFKNLVYSTLAGEVDETGEAKIIAPRENQIIDVSNSVFDAMLSDVQVPKSMHHWLARMEMPVLKMAIEDDSLFVDRDHLVRQVVNKIAQLGLLIGEEESEGNAGVKNALDWLVNLIGSDFDGTLSVFDRVSDQLDILIKAQDKKYEDQLKLVINDFETEDEIASVAPSLENEFDSEDDYEEWLRRAHRLGEGDWILFDLDKPNSKRLRAAWIASHTGRIVFVDATGEKDRVVFFEELASLLHSGSAITVDDANEPAMDRAQYSMLQELNEQLVHESTHDPLTGLINRREFEKQIGKALISSRHFETRHALFFIDLDQFNIINTTYGYEAGDLFLVEISKILSTEQDYKAVLARLGSDEFGLLLEDIGLEDALEISEEYIEQVKEHKFMWEGKRVSMGASIGLVALNNKSESITSLMQAAESSCALAKEVGGNQMQLYRIGQARSHRSDIINWVSRIDDVIDQERLKLRCQKIQPIAANSTEKPHYEVLLMLTDENGDDISIQDFIEAAECSNRITDIDHWVINETLMWISENKEILDVVDSFSINLSGRSLSNEKLVDYIIDKIEEYGVPPEVLCFEITETIGIESLSDSADFINRIKTTGCHFSLDDFGSGMSSYAYLKNLPVDYLKIDGAFVKEIKSSICDYAVVKSICEIGHFMGKRVIAEYAEDADIIAMLAEIGVDFAQGYGVEKPLMINELLHRASFK